MPLFVLEYRYADPELRKAVRPRHLDYVAGLRERGEVLMAGPFADDSGAMIIYNCADEAAVAQRIADDPYTREDVTVQRQVRQWQAALP